MKRTLNRKYTCTIKKESVEDPRELLLSLVDLGSLDADEALLACVKEMSDAECKRVLGSLTLPSGVEEIEDEVEDDVVPLDDGVQDSDEFSLDDADIEADSESEDADVEEKCNRRRLEAKLRRLERLTLGRKRVW